MPRRALAVVSPDAGDGKTFFTVNLGASLAQLGGRTLIVDADMTVRESHVICDRIEDALKAEVPSVRVTIHVEPDDEAKLPPGTSAVPFA